MSKFLELAKRCEDALAADYRLEEDIALACGWITFNLDRFGQRWQRGHGTVEMYCPRFTLYVDDAMRLIPEGYDRWAVTGRNSATVGMDGDPETIWTFAKTPALALCAASLKTLAYMEEGNGNT